MVLRNLSRSKILSNELEVASTFFARLQGLMGKKNYTGCLWIHSCKSIHTCWMRFSIDALYVDKNLVVKKVYRNLPPWRMTAVHWDASSVFEIKSGTLAADSVQEGDQLHVDA